MMQILSLMQRQAALTMNHEGAFKFHRFFAKGKEKEIEKPGAPRP